MTEITEAEILEALRTALTETGDEGLTAGEIAAKAGWGEERARKNIRRLLAQGKMACGRARRTRIDGLVTWVPVYRMVA